LKQLSCFICLFHFIYLLLTLNKDLFKPLQTGTRVLQSFCDHGKIAGSTALLALAPALRKALESLVYRVELLLASSNFTNAFVLGALRHKDILSMVFLILPPPLFPESQKPRRTAITLRIR
jgi:hypothetical protein